MNNKNQIHEIPYYLQIKELIKSKIESGEYPIGYKLQSDSELAKYYGINRLTVRTGLDLLVKEGYLKTISGKGTYVIKSPYIEEFKNFDSYKNIINEDNTSVIRKELRYAGPYFSSKFNISYDDLIYKFLILKTVDNEPFSLDYVYIKHDKIKKLLGFDLKVFSLDEIYELYGLNISKTTQILEACYSNESVSKHLEVDIGTPLIRITSNKIVDDTIFEFKINYTRPDKCSFINEF